MFDEKYFKYLIEICKVLKRNIPSDIYLNHLKISPLNEIKKYEIILTNSFNLYNELEFLSNELIPIKEKVKCVFIEEEHFFQNLYVYRTIQIAK